MYFIFLLFTYLYLYLFTNFLYSLFHELMFCNLSFITGMNIKYKKYFREFTKCYQFQFSSVIVTPLLIDNIVLRLFK